MVVPLCLSSNRASFVNSYSSVRVRPGAPAFACRLRLGGPFYGDHDVTAASRPVKAFVPVRIRLVTPISMGRSWSVILHHKEGVPSVAKALAVRVRFPAWSASVRSRHLSIVICRSSDIRCARLRTASTKFVRKRRLRGQSRSSTAIEHPKKFGKRGFDSHRARHFRRAVEFGLSAKRETASAFKPRTIGQPMDSHLAFCPSFFFGMGRCALVIELGSSNCDRAAREN